MLGGVSAVDLFCGAGGLTHGLIRAGISVNAGIDIDLTCKYPYERNNQTRFIHSNIKDVSVEGLERLYPKKDLKILSGCAPCQPFSPHSNKIRNKEKDQRWTLLHEFNRLVNGMKPNIVTMENVITLTNFDIFKDFTENLKNEGYHIFWEKVFCPDYGIPQNRRRLVLLASLNDDIKLIKKTHKKKNYRTLLNAIGHMEALPVGEASKKDPLHRSQSLTPINKKRILQSKPNGTWRDWDEELLLECHKKKNGSTYGAVYGRLSWDQPSSTITTQFYNLGAGRFGHPTQNRALSLREGALLQTFPPYYDFIDPGLNFSLKRIGIHIGNAVPVRLGEVVGESIIQHIKEIQNGRK